MLARLLTKPSSYLDNEDMTRAALDPDGYYKTGDLAELKNGEYVFHGRASSDCKFLSQRPGRTELIPC